MNPSTEEKCKHSKKDKEMEFLEESLFVPKKMTSRNNKSFCDSQINELLKLVEKDPVIYDENLSGFSSSEISEARKEAWTKISSQMNMNCMFF